MLAQIDAGLFRYQQGEPRRCSMRPMPIIDRRTFLAASVSLSAAGTLPAFPESPALFVLDRRFANLGTVPSSGIAWIEADVTALWRDRLDALWRSSSASVGGVTEPATLFCLEQLARGMGRRVCLRQPIPGTNAVRWVISPVSTRGST
jgi:hypothetical protein